VTNEEFTSWIEDHYSELKAVAYKRTSHLENAEDAVQDAVRCVTEGRIVRLMPKGCWSYMVKMVRTAVFNAQRADSTRADREQDYVAGTLKPHAVANPHDAARRNGAQLIPMRSDETAFDIYWLRAHGELERKSFHSSSHFGEVGIPYCIFGRSDQWRAVQFGQEIAR